MHFCPPLRIHQPRGAIRVARGTEADRRLAQVRQDKYCFSMIAVIHLARDGIALSRRREPSCRVCGVLHGGESTNLKPRKK